MTRPSLPNDAVLVVFKVVTLMDHLTEPALTLNRTPANSRETVVAWKANTCTSAVELSGLRAE